MKAFTLILSLLIAGNLFAHQHFINCPKNNRLDVHLWDMSDGTGKKFIKVTLPEGHFSNGSVDSIFQADVLNWDFWLNLPAITKGLKYKFQNTNQNGSANGEVYFVAMPDCTPTPLKFGGPPVVQKLGNGYYGVTIVVHDVVNVERVEIRIKIEGEEYKVVAYILPDNTPEVKKYYAKFKIN